MTKVYRHTPSVGVDRFSDSDFNMKGFNPLLVYSDVYTEWDSLALLFLECQNSI